jgi:hypothetical protein
MNHMTPNQAREWMISHWDADEVGTDLDVEILDDAHFAILGRYPKHDEDAFGNLKNHLLPILSAEEVAEIETNTNQTPTH